MISRFRSKSLGFTLIEVMLAIGCFFSIAGVALLSAASNNARNIGHLEDKMFANWVASNQLVAVSLDTTWPPKKTMLKVRLKWLAEHGFGPKK